MFTVVVALKAWGSNFSGKKIVINCDNLVTVRVINQEINFYSLF
jgi:hypothetical protein